MRPWRRLKAAVRRRWPLAFDFELGPFSADDVRQGF